MVVHLGNAYAGESERRVLPPRLLISRRRWSRYAKREARSVRPAADFGWAMRCTVANGRLTGAISRSAVDWNRRLGKLKLVLVSGRPKGEPSRAGGCAVASRRLPPNGPLSMFRSPRLRIVGAAVWVSSGKAVSASSIKVSDTRDAAAATSDSWGADEDDTKDGILSVLGLNGSSVCAVLALLELSSFGPSGNPKLEKADGSVKKSVPRPGRRRRSWLRCLVRRVF